MPLDFTGVPNTWPLSVVFKKGARYFPNLWQHVSNGLQLSFTLGLFLLVFRPMNLAKI